MTPGTQPESDHRKTVRDAISRNVAVDIAARIGYLVTRFFIPPYVLAHVSLEAYGLWATAFIVVSYIGVSTMGISGVNIKYVAEYSARREFERANALISTGLLLTVPACAAIFGVVYLLWPRILDHLSVSPAMRGDAREVVLAVVAIFLVSTGLSAFRDTLLGCQMGAAVQVSWVAGYLLECVLILVLVGIGRGIRGLAEAFLIRTLVEVGVCAWIAFRTIPWLRVSPRLFSRDAVRNVLSFGGVVQLTSFLAVALNSIERAVAIPLVGLEAAGLLDIGQKLPSMASSVPSAFANAFTPAASYLKGGLEGTPQERDALHKLFLKGARYMNLTTAYLCGLMATIPLPLLDVWMGKRYVGAAFLMIVFSVATQIHLMTGPGTSILKGIGRPKEEFHYALPNVAAAAILIPLSRLILGQWTAVGIGTAVAAATIVSALYFIGHANRVLGIPAGLYFRRVFLPGAMPYAIGLACVWPAYHWVSYQHRWIGVPIVGGIGLAYTAAVFGATAWLVLDPGERYWFLELTKNARRRLLGRL
jgi:O-antigen/teichoic acid export membrane protein